MAEGRRRLFQIPLALVALMLPACSAAAPGEPESLTCQGIVAPSTPDGSQAADPDMTLYGYPRVGASGDFVPGRPLVIQTEGLTVELPADLYTAPLRFELLVEDEAVWQRCVGSRRRVLLPYAFRTTDAGGRRVPRWDKPAQMVITHPLIDHNAVYWITTPGNPPRAQPASQQPSLSGTTLRVPQQGARIGWFVTVPTA